MRVKNVVLKKCVKNVTKKMWVKNVGLKKMWTRKYGNKKLENNNCERRNVSKKMWD